MMTDNVPMVFKKIIKLKVQPTPIELSIGTETRDIIPAINCLRKVKSALTEADWVGNESIK